MASVKIVLRKVKKADGSYPLALRVTKNRKSSYIYLDYSVKPSDWDTKERRVKASHPNHVRLNNYLLKELAKASDTSLELEGSSPAVSAKAVTSKVKPKVAATFFPQAEDYLTDLKKAGKYNPYTSEKPRIKHFRQFLNDGDIAFSDITPGLLDKFCVWLKHTYKPTGKKKKRLADRSIVNHLVTIRSVFAHARRNKIIKRGETPFGEDGVKIEFPDTLKIPISVEELERLESIELPDPRHEHARKLWLFSFYFAGMRGSDVMRLKWSDFQNYRLHYTMGKNDKGGSLKLPDEAVAILKYYEQFKDKNGGFVFPELKGVDLEDEFNSKRVISYKISRIDKFLRTHVAPAAGITSKLTMHIARHTFGDLAGDSIPVQKLQKLYRHTSIETTIGYQKNFIHKDADDALDAVLNSRKRPEKPETPSSTAEQFRENHDADPGDEAETQPKPKHGLVVAFKRK